jgi:hypothetical protein
VASLGRRDCRIEVQNSWAGFAGGRIPGLRRRPWPGAAVTARPRRRGGRPATLGRSLLGSGRAGSAGGHAGAAAKEDDIAALPESGRGIDIMRACVDDVSMTTGPEHRTVVSLHKRLAWRPGAPFADALDDELEDGELADAG